MNIDFSNLGVRAKKLFFHYSHDGIRSDQHGLFQISNNKIKTLSLSNFNADSVHSMDLCFVRNDKLQSIEFNNCSFKSVTSLDSCFSHNYSLDTVITDGSIIAGLNKPDINSSTPKEEALFPSADDIETIFMCCDSLRYLNLVPLFGDKYSLKRSNWAFAHVDNLISVNLGDVTLIETHMDTSFDIGDNILLNGSNTIAKVYFSSSDKDTLDTLRKFRALGTRVFESRFLE